MNEVSGFAERDFVATSRSYAALDAERDFVATSRSYAALDSDYVAFQFEN